MKCSINRKELSRIVDVSKTFSPSRTPKPILQFVKLSAGCDGAYLSATDLESGIRHGIAAIDVLSPGSVLLPISRLVALLKDCTDDTLHIHGDEHTGATIRGALTTATLPGENACDFPLAVSPFTSLDFVSLDAATLALAIKQTIYACDTESSRYALGGLLLELADDTLNIVGTDGRRLAYTSARVQIHGSPNLLVQFPPETVNGKEITHEPQAAIVPVAVLKRLAKALPKTGRVEISTHGASITFHTDALQIETRGQQGRFPRWRDVIPYYYADTLHTVKLPIAATLAAIKAASVATSEESRGVDCILSRDLLTFKGKSADNGEASGAVSIDYHGPAITITLDPRFMADTLNSFDKKWPAHFAVVDGEKPGVISQDAAACVVMPLARDRR